MRQIARHGDSIGRWSNQGWINDRNHVESSQTLFDAVSGDIEKIVSTLTNIFFASESVNWNEKGNIASDNSVLFLRSHITMD